MRYRRPSSWVPAGPRTRLNSECTCTEALTLGHETGRLQVHEDMCKSRNRLADETIAFAAPRNPGIERMLGGICWSQRHASDSISLNALRWPSFDVHETENNDPFYGVGEIGMCIMSGSHPRHPSSSEVVALWQDLGLWLYFASTCEKCIGAVHPTHMH